MISNFLSSYITIYVIYKYLQVGLHAIEVVTIYLYLGLRLGSESRGRLGYRLWGLELLDLKNKNTIRFLKY